MTQKVERIGPIISFQSSAIQCLILSICPRNVRKRFKIRSEQHSSSFGRIAPLAQGVFALQSYLGVPKRRKSKKGKYYDLNLHDRILFFALKDSSAGAQLMALKWFGNTGSHDNMVSKDDLLDAFEILEHALVEIIDRRSAKVALLAKQLTKKHKKRR